MNGADEKDYYAILGVLRSADSADVAAAYRALARKYHPDTSNADAESLLKFKLINEAYEVLSDVHKRRAYDRSFGRSTTNTIPVTVNSFHAPPQAQSAVQSSPATTLPTSKDFEVELPIAPEEARFGGPCELTLTIPQSCAPCGGAGRDENGTCSVCDGRGKIRCRHRIQFTIPRGVTTGSIVRLPLQQRELRRLVGDLRVRFKIQPCW